MKNYQKENGLVIDGIIGKETYKHLKGVTLNINIEPSVNYINTTVYSALEDTNEVPTPTIVTTIEKAEKNDINKVDFLQNGDKGQAVKDLQRLLKNKGFYHSNIDGAFGPITEAAVREYQMHTQLLVDGIAGPSTITHLTNVPISQIPSRSSVGPRKTENNSNNNSNNTSTIEQPLEQSVSSSNSIINIAKTFIGTRYLWGGTTPNAFDCSGFLKYVYKKHGINLPRTVAEIWSYGQNIQTLQTGDLIFFETYKKGPSHAGMN
ncbi:hypothetical protein BKP37_16100 [Anaerobacillus alkalilacustris]|uniref:NlpC/P60 domain-containing protein n=1 Tax=Anaerobacillus alkalilacustris TaxID=393763 RepID=A0A1S2LF92_9BACI|nr:peptidoglycan-binding protein [Anaerobacillus alkalilacustris]OIJ11178.1 hypothetical protein BKP37_16100 [Anaerobacillus alkalilacustris]